MAIQNRRGVYTDFDASKMVAGEFAVVQSGDPDSSNGTSLYISFQSGTVKRIILADDLDGIIGSLDDLETTDKTNIINAINEISEKATIYHGVTSTSGATRDKVVVCSDFELKDGVYIAVDFSQNNTATNARLDVNNTGAKSIVASENSYVTDWIISGSTYLFRFEDDALGGAYYLIGATERIPSDSTPIMDGTAASGTSKQYARADHVHPSDTTRATVAALNETNAEVSQLKGDLSGVIPTRINCTLENGTIVNPYNANAVRIANSIPCKKGDVVVFYPVRPNTAGYVYLYGYRIYDANDNTLANVQDATATGNEVNITYDNAETIKFFWVESDGTNMNPLRANTYGYVPYAIVKNGSTLKEKVESLETITDSVVEDLSDVTGKIEPEIIANEYVETSGVFTPYDGWSRTDYINVSGYSQLYINWSVSSAYNVWYTSSKTKINNVSIPANGASVNIPSNAAYIVISNTTVAMDSAVFKLLTSDQVALQKTPRNLMIGDGIADKVKGYLISEMSNTYIENGTVIPVNRYVSLTQCHRISKPIDINFTDLSFKIVYYNSDDISDFNHETAWSTATKRIQANSYFTIHAQQSTALSLDTAFEKLTVIAPKIVESHNEYELPVKTYGTQYSNPARVQLLWFSDIHADVKRLKRIVDYWQTHSNELSDAICTGDMVADKVTDDFTFWDTAGAENILTIIGNHDGNTGSGWADSQTLYNKFFAPYIENWGVTYTANYCNWYKVYNSKVMLIGLNAVNSTSAEATEMLNFLDTALQLAKTNGYTVVIAHHYPINPTATNSYNTPFETVGFNPTDLFIPTSVIEAVSNFKTSGGDFACYITGHTHADLSRYTIADKQIVLTISTAFISAGIQEYAQYRSIDTKYEDLFNIFYVDPVKKVVAIKRIGSDRDVWFRKLDYLAINYETAEMI